MLKVDRDNILGRGAFSIVVAGTFGKQPVAVKRFLRQEVHPKWRNVDECAEKMTALVHPNVVSVKSVYDDDEDFRNIVMERCLADLFDYCRKKYDGPMPNHHDGLVQLVSGLNYIHSQGFIHRRLTMNNILVSSVQFKISDFGMTDPQSACSMTLLNFLRRPASTEAPELLQLELSEGEKELHHTAASDTFSLGCILALFFTRGSHPFGSSSINVPVNIIENKYNFKADMPYIHIVEQMIKKFPQERIPLDKILSMLKV
jgi:serine/threonine protein kinase